MLRRVDDPDPMGRIAEKRCPRVHRLENAASPFDAQILGDLTGVSDPADQRFGLMRIELIEHKHPAVLWSQGHRALEMRDEIGFCPRIADRRANDVARHHVEIGQETLGAVTGVFKFNAFHVTGSHRLDALAFQRLNARHLIRTDRVGAFDSQGGSLLVGGTHSGNAILKDLRVLLGGLQPIPGFMRLEVRLILKNGPHWPEKSK